MRPPRAEARAYVTLGELMRLRGDSRGFSLLPRQPPRSVLAGRHASRLRGRGLDFRELRRYQDGDDVRMIDWLATARQRSPHVRVYTEERDRVVLLLVDQRRSMFFGSRRAMKSVAAAETAALAAWRVQAAGDRIGAIVFDDARMSVVRPLRGLPTVERVLGEVVRANNALRVDGGPANPAMLNAALRQAVEIAKHDCLLVLISDAAGANEETRRLVSAIAAHNDVVAVFVHDALEAALPSLGRVIVAEGTDRLALDSSAARLQRGHAAQFADLEARIGTFARQRAIPVLPVRTDQDTAAQLRAALSPGRRG